jgi:hypothetical protein
MEGLRRREWGGEKGSHTFITRIPVPAIPNSEELPLAKSRFILAIYIYKI